MAVEVVVEEDEEREEKDPTKSTTMSQGEKKTFCRGQDADVAQQNSSCSTFQLPGETVTTQMTIEAVPSPRVRSGLG